jgi:large subunit ribosomal protein L33
MAKKSKGNRVLVTLECLNCKNNLNKQRMGINRYITTKNRKKNISRLELNKFCAYCNNHTLHKEIK